MAITPQDVKLYESQRLTDEDDGGGLATGNVIIDGQVNNLFPDISRLDRTIGDVALRKAFIGIDTANADVYLGAHAIITKKPADPRVSALLFKTSTPGDERVAAQSQIESYVVRGAQANWFLLGNQYVGQRILIGFQEETQAVPEVGDVYELWQGANTQFVRITDIEHTDEIFAYDRNGAVSYLPRRKLTMGISSPLENTYTGGTPSPGGTTDNSTSVNTTEVADAARYYGAAELATAGAPGDYTITVDSVYSNLVPSAQSESVFADQPGAYRRPMLPAAGLPRSEYTNAVPYIDHTLTFYTYRPIQPGTLTLTLTGQGSSYTDDGKGNLIHAGGADQHYGTVDYTNGIVYATRDNVSGNAAMDVAYTPAGPLIGQAESGSIDIELQNRSFSYTLNLAASKPRPGTLIISYLALGKWQTLEDSGNGELTGNGTGSINFATGTVVITLPAMPDAGSALVYGYIANVANEITTPTGTVAVAPQHRLQLEAGVKPGTLTLTWTAGTAKTATDNGAGQITGDATGQIVYSSGEVLITPAAIIDNNTVITADYDAGSPTLESFNSGVIANDSASFTIAGAPVRPGSVSIEYNVNQRQPIVRNVAHSDDYLWAQEATVPITLRDDGANGFIDQDGNTVTGSINYTTGAVSVTVQNDVAVQTVIGKKTPEGLLTTQNYTTESVMGLEYIKQDVAGDINVRFQPDALSSATEQTLTTVETLLLELIPEPNPIVPRSVLFTFGGDEYVDADGILYRGPSNITGLGTAVGSIDYATGNAEITDWPNGAGATVDIETIVTQSANIATSVINFRTQGRPLRPGSLQISAVRMDTSELITATADNEGVITATGVTGKVNVELGLVQLWFTSDDTDETGASDIPVYPGSLRYNAVSYSYLPLDAELIGIDPVRLPADGRVPIFRDGDVLIITNEQIDALGSPSAGETVALARPYIGYCRVIDANDVYMDTNEYTVDYDAGEVTFNNPVTFVDANNDPLTLPLRAIERIEHMTVITDAQISGDLTLLSPLPHTFTAPGTIASSALLFGDINARVFNEFTQKTWSSSNPNWTDSRIGDDTTASYNLVDSPVTVANHGAITERWAIVFTGTTSFQVVGEQVGIIATGSTAADTAPTNPNTGNPYFILLAAGWGTGWTAGNVLRFDTEGCLAPFWASRTVLSGPGTADDDSFTVLIRGDAD